MRKNPTLDEIIQAVDKLSLKRRKKAPQGRKLVYSDSFIIALAIYQKLYSFKYALKMLEVLKSLGLVVPSASSFSERKALLIGQIILAVKTLCSQQTAVKQHIDSKKLEIIDFARANRTKLAGSYGYDAIHKRTFFGLRLHARVDDEGNFCKLLLRPAHQHDVAVAEDLVKGLNYTILTGDKGYISKDLKAQLDKQAVHLVTPKRSNQLPPPKSEQKLYQGHKRVETVFSSLDRLGFSDRPYRSNKGMVLHIFTSLLAYQIRNLIVLILNFRIRVKCS